MLSKDQATLTPLSTHDSIVKRGIKKAAVKENIDPHNPSRGKRKRLELNTAHVGDHSITATEVSAQILANGIDVTVIGQGSDILKQYIDTFFGPVPGFVQNIPTAVYDVNSLVSTLESPGRPWVQVDFTSQVNLPRPRQREVQYTWIIGSRNIKDSNVDINISCCAQQDRRAGYQHFAMGQAIFREHGPYLTHWS